MKWKSRLTAGVFLLMLFGFGLWHLLLPDGDISSAERRTLAQVPELTAQALVSGEYGQALEDYLLDQFPLRQPLRMGKAAMNLYLLRQKDSDGIWLHQGSAIKMEGTLNEAQVRYGGQLMERIRAEYLQDCAVYYAVIPDKNYFAAAEEGYPHLDYDRLVELFSQPLSGSTYIDLFSVLELDDYYDTDAHWRQECIYPVAQALAAGMGTAESLTPEEDYTGQSLSPFYGVYLGQSALPLGGETLTYLTSADTASAVVTGAELEGEQSVYAVERFSGLDGYDVFLHGAQSVLTITCPNARTDRELVIFRDSFASSLAPLFTGAYAKITLVDLRYVSSALLDDYVTFHGQDVLFLYSAPVLNSAMLLR